MVALTALNEIRILDLYPTPKVDYEHPRPFHMEVAPFHLNGYTLRVLSTDLKVSTTLYSIINHHTKVLLIVSDINNFLSQVIEQNLKKLIFYYGATDHWAPVSYYEDMKKKFPEGEICLLKGSLNMHLFWNLQRKSLKWLHPGYKM